MRAGLYNLSLKSTRADIIRAFFEGVAYNTRWLLAPVEKFMARKVQSIHIAGGGATSDVWCEVFADIMNLEIKQVKDPIQANARGAAFIAAVGLHDINFEDIPALIKFKQVYQPNPATQQCYAQGFAHFKLIYQQMASLYKKNEHPITKYYQVQI